MQEEIPQLKTQLKELSKMDTIKELKKQLKYCKNPDCHNKASHGSDYCSHYCEQKMKFKEELEKIEPRKIMCPPRGSMGPLRGYI